MHIFGWKYFAKHINNTSMTHRFTIKAIAAQSGLGVATIDRVLNARANVSAQTKARVAAAMSELEAQEGQLAARGRTVWIDVVVEAPQRFSREIRHAAETAMPMMRPVVVRPRFTMHEVVEVSQMVATLRRIARRGTGGVCLKARDVPLIRAEVASLVAKGIPVVTLVTDVPGRLAYAGVDNVRAGKVAAALIARQVQTGVVVTSQSREDFAGETARISAFRAALANLAPNVWIVALPDAAGLNTATSRAATQTLAQVGDVSGVYSAGGGNWAISAALSNRPIVFVAHDLDDDNKALLSEGGIDFVLHHDLVSDMQTAFRHILGAHGLVGPVQQQLADVQVILRENMPTDG